MVYMIPDSGISNCYLISGRDGLMAVDIGSIGAANALIRFINETLGQPLSVVKYIAATHFHIDHIGGNRDTAQGMPTGDEGSFSFIREELSGRVAPPPADSKLDIRAPAYGICEFRTSQVTVTFDV